MQYVDDLVEGVFKLMRRPEVHPVNIGNPIEYTVKEIGALILELSGSASAFTHKPLPQDDPKQRCPEITRSREVLRLGSKRLRRRRALAHHKLVRQTYRKGEPVEDRKYYRMRYVVAGQPSPLSVELSDEYAGFHPAKVGTR